MFLYFPEIYYRKIKTALKDLNNFTNDEFSIRILELNKKFVDINDDKNPLNSKNLINEEFFVKVYEFYFIFNVFSKK